ncbi:AsmA family protein [uncultured Desulfovibrio sp.]|uniref:AsmA family protein n=3 Tax=Desulfovibrio TaxID=872 RepID=A0A212L3W6_9BACT|nr:AsmA family protein [uncultured Desulfovibrio sp.]
MILALSTRTAAFAGEECSGMRATRVFGDMMKRFLLWTAGVLLVVAAALAIVLSQIDAAFVIRQIADATARSTGKPLVFETAPQISLFPPGVRFGQARWGQPEMGDGLVFSVKSGMAELELMPLLSGSMVVREVRLDNPVVDVRQYAAAPAVPAPTGADGAASAAAPTPAPDHITAPASGAAVPAPDKAPASTSGAADSRVSGSPAGAPAPKAGVKAPAVEQAKTLERAAPAIELKRLVARQGMVRYTDAQGQTLTLGDLNLSVENLRPGQEAVAQCDFTFTASRPDTTGTTDTTADTAKGTAKDGAAMPVPLSANLALSAKLRYAPPNIALRQTLLTLSPLAGPLPKEAGPLQLNIEGSLDTDAWRMHVAKCWITTPQARLGLQGEASFNPPSFTGNLELDASLRKLAALAGQPLKPAPRDVTDTLKIKSRLAYGDNSLNLSDIDALVDDVTLSGQFRLGMEPGAPLSITTDMQVSAVNLDAYLPLPESGKPQGQTTDGPKGKKSGGTDVSPLPDINIRAALAGISQGKVRARDVQFVAQGLRGNYKISTFNCTLGSGGFIKAEGTANVPAAAYTVNGTASDVDLGALLESLDKGRPVEGTARLDADLSMHGKSAVALQNSLSGSGLLEIRQMRLKSLPTLPANVPGIVGKPVPDTFESARAPFTIKNGDIHASPVTVSATGLSARGQAKISLPRQYLEASATVETLGMSVPVIAKGPFTNIGYSLDPRFAQGKGKKLPGLLQDGIRGAEGFVRDLFGN